MYILRDKRDGKIYQATKGTEHGDDAYSAYELPHRTGFGIVLFPEHVEVLMEIPRQRAGLDDSSCNDIEVHLREIRAAVNSLNCGSEIVARVHGNIQAAREVLKQVLVPLNDDPKELRLTRRK